MANKEEEITQITARGIITGTSDKQTDKFKVESPRKSIYFVPDSKTDIEKLQELGLTLYTPEKEKDGEPFFIIKASEKMTLYAMLDAQVPEEYGVIQTKLGDKNFNSDEKVVTLAILKGNKANNDYYRAYAILTTDEDTIQTVEKENPFLNL